MKKKRSWLFILPFILCAAATIIYSAVFVWSDDSTPPVITIDSGEIEVSVLSEESELFRGVSAVDERDGDVSADIVVEKISNITDERTATITYAAFDRSGNVAKATRRVRYTDYTEPRFGLTRALIFQKGGSPDVLSYVTAEDQVDGDLGDKVKGTLVSDTSSLSYSGIHEIDFRVTNSMGDTVHLVLPVEVYDTGEYNATAALEQYLVYIQRDSDFRAESYLKELTIGSLDYSLKGDDPEIALYINGQRVGDAGTENPDDPGENGGAIDPEDIIRIDIDMKNEVNTGVPGVYSVTYTVTMNRYIGYTRLIVVVEE
ncbi:MAG: hypothetical protein IJZ85_02620 [Lachnospiraceae bacterium]|nr:hypothetical protein [Lachnospiraceae bacterium]